MELSANFKHLIGQEWKFTDAREFARDFAARHAVSADAVETYLRRTYPYSSVSEPSKRSKVKRHLPKKWVNAGLYRGSLVQSDTFRMIKGFKPPAYKFVVGVTDYFSKMVYLEAVTRITSAKVSDALSKIFARMRYQVRTFLTDLGSVSHMCSTRPYVHSTVVPFVAGIFGSGNSAVIENAIDTASFDHKTISQQSIPD